MNIKLSSNSNHVLSEEKDQISLALKDVAEKNIFILSKNADSFNFNLNGSDVCVENNVLKKCKFASLFNIIESKYGYKINRQGKCLTIDSKGLVIMENCKENNRLQTFVFEDLSGKFCVENSKNRKLIQKGKIHLNINSRILESDKNINKELARHGIMDPRTKKDLRDLWRKRNWPKWKWPSRIIC